MQVENRVVGVPCGVMDHRASACGEANKLLAMVCQLERGKKEFYCYFSLYRETRIAAS